MSCERTVLGRVRSAGSIPSSLIQSKSASAPAFSSRTVVLNDDQNTSIPVGAPFLTARAISADLAVWDPPAMLSFIGKP